MKSILRPSITGRSKQQRCKQRGTKYLKRCRFRRDFKSPFQKNAFWWPLDRAPEQTLLIVVNHKITPAGHENKPQKDDLLSPHFQNYSVSSFSVSHTSHSMLLSLETLNRALGFSEYAELVLVLPTNIMTLSRDGEPISPELDWRRPSSVSIPNQESIRWGLLIGNGRITDKIGFRLVESFRFIWFL